MYQDDWVSFTHNLVINSLLPNPNLTPGYFDELPHIVTIEASSRIFLQELLDLSKLSGAQAEFCGLDILFNLPGMASADNCTCYRWMS